MAVEDASENLPPERDVKEFKFKQLTKIRISESPSEIPKQRTQLLAISNKYGLVFLACTNGFKVLKTSSIGEIYQQHERDHGVVEDASFWTEVPTGHQATHLAVSSDDLTLAVCVRKSAGAFALMYDMRAFATQNAKPSPFLETRLGYDANSTITDFKWNPGSDYSCLLAYCTSEGGVALLQVKDDLTTMASLPPTTLATCLCWSPKGKQLVVGKKNGTLTQYDQALREKKQLPSPSVFSDPVKVTDVLWQSTHVFLAAYEPNPSDSDEQPSLVIVNAPKGGVPSFVNYEDICYGCGEERDRGYYLMQSPEWELVLGASHTSLEVGLLGKALQDKNVWERWSLEDSARAELPLTEDHDETYPAGIAVDFTSRLPIQLGDNQVHPPSPILLLLSTDGVLAPFFMMNVVPGAPALQRQVQPLSAEGQRTRKGGPVSVAAPEFQKKAPAAAISSGATAAGFAAAAAASQPPATFSFSSSTTGGGGFGQPATAAAPSFGGFGQPTSTAPPTGFSFSAAPTGGAPKTGFSFSNTSAADASKTSDAFGVKPSTTGPSATFGTPTSGKVPGIVQPSSGAPASFAAQTSQTVTKPVALPATAVQAAPRSPGPAVGGTIKVPAPQSKFATATTAVNQPAASVDSAAISRPVPAQPARPTLTATRADRTKPPSPHVVGSAPATVEDPFTKSILDEMAHFEKELMELRLRAASSHVSIGTKEEFGGVRQQTDEMWLFLTDIKSTTQAQHKEINDLKTGCLESFTLLEECKARDQRNKEPRYYNLLRSRPLDPASAKSLKEVKTHYQYVESSLRDVNLALDNQWQQHQSKKKNRSKAMRSPASDAIYHSVSNNHNIIVSQSRAIEQLTSELQSLRLYNTRSTWQQGTAPTITSTPMPHTREEDDTVPALPSMIEASPSPRKVMNRSSMSPLKEGQLRDMLSRRMVTSIKSTAPVNLSMSKLVSAEGLRQMLNNSRDEEEISYIPRTPTKPPPPLSPGVTDIKQPVVPVGKSKSAAIPPVVTVQRFPAAASSGVVIGQSKAFTSGSLFSAKAGAAAAGGGSSPVTGFTAMKPSASTPGTGLQAQTRPIVTSGFAAMKPADSASNASTGFSAMKAATSSPSPIATGFTAITGKSLPRPQQSKSPGGVNLPQAPIVARPLASTATAPPHLTEGQKADEKSSVSSGSITAGTVSGVVPSGTATIGASSSASAFVLGKSVPTSAGFAFNSSSPGAFQFGKESATAPSATTTSSSGGNSVKAAPPSGKRVSEAGATGMSSTAAPSTAAKTASTASSSTSSNLLKMLATSTATTSATPSGFSFGGTPSSSTASGGFSFGASSGATTSLGSSSSIGFSSATTSSDFGTPAKSAAPSGFSFSATSSSGVASTGPDSLSAPSSGFSFGGVGGGSLDKASSFSTSGASTGFSFGGTATPSFSSSGKPNTTSTADASTVSSSSTAAADTTSTTPGSTTSASSNTSTVTSTSSSASTAVSESAKSTTTSVSSSSAPAQSGVPDTTTSTSTAPAVSSTTPDTAESTVSSSTPTPSDSKTAAVSSSSSVSTTPSLFGGSTAPSSGFSFNSKPTPSTTTPTATSVFGSAVSTANTAASFSFLGAAKESSSVFGTTATSTATTATPLFGSSAVSSTAATGLFGGGGSTTASSGGLFGGTTTTAAAATTATATTGLFGTPTTTTASSGGLFGGTTTTSAAATTSAATTGLFGTPTTTTAGSGGLFGGTTTTTASSTGLFGQTATSTAAPTSSTGLFGQTVTSSSTGPSLFGGTTGTSSPSGNLGGFGQASFGKPTFGQQGTFGQTSGSFGGGTGTTPAAGVSSGGFGGGGGGGEGGLFSGLGGKPSEEKANTNVFGQASFGQATTPQGSTGLFGSQAPTSFASAAPASNTGFGANSGGLFSSGTQGVGSTGFGGFQVAAAPTSPGSPGAFGGAPAFGSPPKFGGSPGFGGGFGGAATFGNAPAPTVGFGTPTQDQSANAGFAAFAASSSPTFGVLAQQQPASSAPSFGGAGGGAGGFGGGAGGFGGSTFGGNGFGGGNASFGQSGMGGQSFGQGSSFSSYRS